MGEGMDKNEYDEDTRRALRLFVTLMRCTNAVGDVARYDIARNDLSVSEFAVLELLYHKGPTPLGAVAAQVLLTSGSMTYVIDQLEKQGLVTRVACPKDRRRLHAALTDAGQAKIASIFPGHAAGITQAMSILSSDEQDELARLLKKLGLSLSGAKQADKQANQLADKQTDKPDETHADPPDA